MKALFVALTCGLVAAILYLPASKAEFVWDDMTLIVNNETALDEWSDVPRAFVHRGAAGQTIGYYRPVLTASYVVDARIWGIDPVAFHRTNVLLHAINTMLVWALFYGYLGRALPAAFGALVFACHPIQAQAVGLITARNDLLLAVPFVGALLAQQAWYRSRGTRQLFFGAAMVLLYAATLWTKETGVVLLVVLVAANSLVYGGERTTLRRKLGLFALLCIPVVSYIAVRGVVFGAVVDQGGGQMIPWGARLLHATATLGYYIKRVLLPYGFAATPYHDELVRPFGPQFLLAGFLCVALVAGIVVGLRRRPLLAFGMLVFFACFLPVLGLIPVRMQILEHRAYVPMLGVGLIAGAVLHDMLNFLAARGSVRAQRIAVLFALSVILLFAGITTRRIPVYRNDLALWGDAVQHVPKSAYARYAYGYALRARDRPDEAIAHFEEVLRLRPEHSHARYELALALAQTGRSDESVTELKKLLRQNPRYFNAYYTLAKYLIRQNQNESAYEVLRRGLQVQPDQIGLLVESASILELMDRHDEARDAYERLTSRRPERAEYWRGLGRTAYRMARFREAAHAYTKALQLRPGSAELHFRVGLCLAMANDRDAALEYLRQADRLGYPDTRLLRQLSDRVLSEN